jgi:hypothetical protein
MNIKKIKIKDSDVIFEDNSNQLNSNGEGKIKVNSSKKFWKFLKSVRWIIAIITSLTAFLTFYYRGNPHKITIVGTILINDKNPWSEDVKQVHVKGQTLGGTNTPSDNGFILRDVIVKSDNKVEIAVDLVGKDNLSHSALFELPNVDDKNTVDIGLVTINVKPPQINTNSVRKSVPRVLMSNKYIINNNNNILLQ